MKNKYQVVSIFNDNAISFNDLMMNLISSFIDQDLNLFEDSATLALNKDQNL